MFDFFDYLSLMRIGILEKIREFTRRFSREAKEYARQHGYEVKHEFT